MHADHEFFIIKSPVVASSVKLVLTAFFFVLLLPIHSGFARDYSRTQVMMGNVPVTLTVKASLSQREFVFLAMQKAYERGRTISSLASGFDPASEISLINAGAAQRWMSAGPEIFEMLTLAQLFSDRTNGAFDITFSSPNRKSRSRDIQLDPLKCRVKFKRSGLRVVLSGIAKGYIIDEMSRELRRAGFKKHVVNAGGDLYAAGSWRVAMRAGRPFRVRDKGVSSSGNYERGNHLIDPSTGKPVAGQLSTTAVADSAVESGVYSVASFVLGKKSVNQIRPLSSKVLIWILDPDGLHRYTLKSKER